jgi:hypothetical protein
MNDLERAVRESAEMLGLNPDRLTPADRLQCELIAALRAAVDDALANTTSASSADLGKLIVAVEALTRFLAEAKSGAAERPDEHDDPHANLMRIVEGWIEAEAQERAELASERRAQGLSEPVSDLKTAQARIDQLEAEVARLRNGKALPAPESEKVITPDAKVITPTESEIIPPGEIGDLNMVPPRRSPPTIDGKAEPPAPSDAEREANRLRINNDRSEFYRQGLRPAGTEAWRPHTWRFE